MNNRIRGNSKSPRPGIPVWPEVIVAVDAQPYQLMNDCLAGNSKGFLSSHSVGKHHTRLVLGNALRNLISRQGAAELIPTPLKLAALEVSPARAILGEIRERFRR